MTIATTIHNATQRLAAIGIDTASLDARLLVAHALKLTREEMLSREGHVLTDHERASVEALIVRREAREPVSQILGKRGFWRDEFLVTKDVLTPRPESETMIEALLTLRPERDRDYQMLDLGTGSGCLLLSALREYPKSYGTGVDESEAALNVARANAQALGLDTRAQFIKSDWCMALTKNFRADIVLANPPYIPAGEIATLAPEVRQYDPMRALHGGEDGLQCYRKIFSQLSLYLSPHALILLEVGAGQATEVAEIGRASGMKLSSIVPDLAGFARIVVFQLP
ncbi:MAG: peptide chain release factor N(5)-glutamine methyltransferase [Alphaproteobacteria bacterium]